MPIYEYRCPLCNGIQEIPKRMIERDDCPQCCNVPSCRIVSSVGKPQCYEYYSEGLGARITSPKQKSRLMKAKGLSEVGNESVMR